MKNKRIVILTDYNGHIGQKIHAWESISVSEIIRCFNDYGYEVDTVSYADVANGIVVVQDCFVVHSSSQKSEYKMFIDDVLYNLIKYNNILIPGYEIFRCHENKGYQEIYKRRLDINSLEAFYYGHVTELKREYNFPLILKTVDGFGSSGVFLVMSYNNLIKRVLNLYKISFKEVIKKIVGFEMEPKRWYRGYLERRFIIQEFVPELAYDYKVLVFGSKYYLLKRNVCKGDFKASGSGLFEYVKLDNYEILDYSQKIYKSLKVPYLSLDICQNGGVYSLIEFQGVHFGPLTMMKSEGYYVSRKGNWSYIEGKSILEKEFTSSIHRFIEEQYT